MNVDVFALGIGMIGAATLIGYASMLVILLSALIDSIIERELGATVFSLVLVLFLVGLGSFFVGLIIQ